MAIYFVRPSYLSFLQSVDCNTNLLSNKEKRPFLLVDAKINKIETSVLVPLSMATEKRIQKQLLYKERKSPLASMGTIIYDPDTGEAASIARHDWAVPYNPLAVQKLEFDALFEGRYKEQMNRILKALRRDPTGKPSEKMKEIELNTQVTIDVIRKLKSDPACAAYLAQQDYPDIAKQNCQAKNYQIPADEVFRPIVLTKWNDEQSTDDEQKEGYTQDLFDEKNDEQSQAKPSAPSQQFGGALSFSRVVKGEKLFSYDKEQSPRKDSALYQRSTLSYAAVTKKSPLPQESPQTVTACDEPHEVEQQTLFSNHAEGGIPAPINSKRKPFRKIKLTNLGVSELTFAQAASSSTETPLQLVQTAAKSKPKS
ncbi:MAG: hypothetical protein ACRC9T_04600 [Vibrionaceae bacterium]